ncbi:MAG: hypothetical protein CM1200mP20_03540 [Pseudomonadota bacterium]|nr:MAG: hypothetical protein CM1200mP20_03540 [Pseudomonadota bacterium]
MLTKGMTTSIPFLERISANNSRPVMIAAMFVDPNDPERVFREFGEIEDARTRGRELWGQVGCFPLGMEFTIRHPYPLEAFLAWRPAIEARDESDYQRILADPSFREAIKAEAQTKGVPNRFSYHQFDHLTVMSVADPEHQKKVGQTVGQLPRIVARILSIGYWTSPWMARWMQCWTVSYSILRRIASRICSSTRMPRSPCRMPAPTCPFCVTPDSDYTFLDTGYATGGFVIGTGRGVGHQSAGRNLPDQ